MELTTSTIISITHQMVNVWLLDFFLTTSTRTLFIIFKFDWERGGLDWERG